MIRALTYVMAAAVLVWTICEIAERVDSKAARPGRAAPAARAAAAPRPSAAAGKPRGKGVLIENETGRRFTTP